MLDRQRGGVPLYQQLADELVARIDGNRMRPGDVLPGEHELMREFEVSRATVVKALETLAGRGLVQREQGRGTFVGSPPLQRQLPELTGFSQHVQSLGMRPGHRLVRYDRTSATPSDPLLAPFASGQSLVVAERIRFADDQAAGLHRTVLPADLAERIGFTEDALRRTELSLYALLDAAGVLLDRGEETLRAVASQEREAALLDLPAGTPLIEVTRRSYDQTGRLVEAVRARYRGDLYVYHVDLGRPKPAQDRRSEHDARSRTGGTRRGPIDARGVGIAARRVR